DLFAQAHTGPQVIGLDTGDELAWAADSQGEGEVMLVTALGQAIRFAEDEVRPMGLPAGGVGGIKLREGDRVVAGLALAKTTAEEAPGGRKPAITRLALISKGGFGKQVALADFPAQGRYGGGVVAAKVLPKSGNIAGAALLASDDHLVCLTATGASQVLAAPVLPVMARAAQGKAIPALSQLGPIERIYAVKAGAEPAPNGGRNGDGGGSPVNGSVAAPGTATDAARTRARRSGPVDGNGVGPAGSESATTAKTARRTRPSITAGAASPETAEKAPAKAGRKRVADQAETAPVRPTRNGRAKTSAGADEGTAPAKRGAAAKADTAPGSSPVAAPTRAETHASAATGSPQPSRTARKPVAAKAAGESASVPAPKRGAAAQAKAEPGSAGATARTRAQTPAPPAASARPERASRKPAVPAAEQQPAKTPAKEPGAKAGKQTPAAPPARGTQLPLVAPDDLPAPRAHQAPPPRPRHSAADGPMTWPRVPDGEEEDHRRNSPPPRRRT
ncbi:MAG TPA: DNA gyrase C-terminal beta-propeller domain-containing protein, partial [Anaerolineae bacterium]